MHKRYFHSVVRGLQSTIEKAAKEDKAPPPKSKESEGPEETEYPGGKPPRTVGEIIASAGEEGATFAEIIRRYAELSGQRSRKVNRTTILYSIDAMLEKGTIIAVNREGMTVYKLAKYGKSNSEAKTEDKPAVKEDKE